MAGTYRNARTGRVVTMPDPADVEADAPNEAQGKWLAMHARKAIEAMDASSKWERIEPDDGGESEGTAASDPVVADEPEADDGGEAEEQVVERPARADPKAAWVDYHVAQGLDRDEAESMTKADLIDLA